MMVLENLRLEHYAKGEAIQQCSFTADQTRLIDTIITYLTKNGTIDKEMLFEPPSPTKVTKASWAFSRRMLRCVQSSESSTESTPTLRWLDWNCLLSTTENTPHPVLQ